MELLLNGKVRLFCGDCRESLEELADNSVDSGVMDPPYALVSIGKRFGKEGAAPAKAGATGAYARASAGFMGKQWDTGETAFAVEFWEQVFRVLKPGAHLVAFSGTRTYHRMACAIEDAGFEIRDQLAWTYGSGFPKSHDIALAIDKAAGVPPRGKAFNLKGRGDRAEELDANGRQHLPNYEPATDDSRHWQGWGTALKPAWEPIVLARKPISEKTVAANVLRWGTGAINVDGCRIESVRPAADFSVPDMRGGNYDSDTSDKPRLTVSQGENLGRFPANIIHDGSAEVIAAFPESESPPPRKTKRSPDDGKRTGYGTFAGQAEVTIGFGDSGSAARFFYSAKADPQDRLGSKHPTIKPVDLMQWLCRLITPPGGVVLDAFAGTGSTGEAAWREGFEAILCEREPEYQDDIRRRMELALGGTNARKREHQKKRNKPAALGGIFGDE